MVMFWQIGTLQAVGSRGRAEWGPRGCVVCLLWVCLHVLPPPTPDFYTPSPPQECGSDPCVQDVANERCHNENSPTPSDDPKRLAPDLGHAHCLLVGDNHDGGKTIGVLKGLSRHVFPLFLPNQFPTLYSANDLTPAFTSTPWPVLHSVLPPYPM